MFQPDLFKETREEDLILTFPIPPRAWMRTGQNRGKGRVILFTPTELKNYYSQIRASCHDQLPVDFKPFEEPIDLELYLGKGWSQIRVRTNPHRPRLLRGDLSNYLKAHEDALQVKKNEILPGVLWKNDRQICRVHVEEVNVELQEITQAEQEREG